MILRHRNTAYLCDILTPEHDILIEGYPRCANSFAVRALMYNNGWRGIRIATHSHSPSQVILARKWNIPTLVLIRDPDDAVPSMLALAIQSEKMDPEIMSSKDWIRWIKYLTKRYERFYSSIEGIKQSFVIAPFDEVVENFDRIIERINKKYSVEFSMFEHNPDNVQHIFSTSRKHLSPNQQRENYKQQLKELYFSNDNTSQRNQAQEVYNDMKYSLRNIL